MLVAGGPLATAALNHTCRFPPVAQLADDANKLPLSNVRLLVSAAIWRRPRLVTASTVSTRLVTAHRDTRTVMRFPPGKKLMISSELNSVSVCVCVLESFRIGTLSKRAAMLAASLPADTRQCSTWRLCLARSKVTKTGAQLRAQSWARTNFSVLPPVTDVNRPSSFFFARSCFSFFFFSSLLLSPSSQSTVLHSPLPISPSLLSLSLSFSTTSDHWLRISRGRASWQAGREAGFQLRSEWVAAALGSSSASPSALCHCIAAQEN